MELVPNLPDDIIHECFVRVHHNMIPTIAALSKGWKKEVQSLEFYNRRKADGLTRSIVVLPNWTTWRPDRKNLHSTFILHDPETCLTTNLPPIPRFSNSKQLWVSSRCVGVGQNLVVIREYGTNSSIDPAFNVVFVYSFSYAKWRRGADMPGEARSGFAFVSDSNRMVFVVGGHEIKKKDSALRCAMAYDVLEDKWFSLPDMHTEKVNCKGTFLLGKLYITNQRISAGELVRRESFDIATGQWELLEEDRWKIITGLVSYKRKMYRCRDGNIAVLEGDKWQNIAILPYLHEECWAQRLVAGKGNLLVTGYHGFGCHYSIYMLNLENYKWTKLKVPKDYRSVGNAMCCLEIMS